MLTNLQTDADKLLSTAFEGLKEWNRSQLTEELRKFIAALTHEAINKLVQGGAYGDEAKLRQVHVPRGVHPRRCRRTDASGTRSWRAQMTFIVGSSRSAPPLLCNVSGHLRGGRRSGMEGDVLAAGGAEEGGKY